MSSNKYTDSNTENIHTIKHRKEMDGRKGKSLSPYGLKGVVTTRLFVKLSPRWTDKAWLQTGRIRERSANRKASSRNDNSISDATDIDEVLC